MSLDYYLRSLNQHQLTLHRMKYMYTLTVAVFVALIACTLVPKARKADPCHILEQITLTVPRDGSEAADTPIALGRADWTETPQAHLFSLDVPGVKREDINIVVEESGWVLRINGKRDVEGARGGKRRRTERASQNSFLRRFELKERAELETINAELESGVLRVTVIKVVKQAKVVTVVEKKKEGEDIGAAKE